MFGMALYDGRRSTLLSLALSLSLSSTSIITIFPCTGWHTLRRSRKCITLSFSPSPLPISSQSPQAAVWELMKAAAYVVLLEAMGRVGWAGASGPKPPLANLEEVYESWPPRIFVAGSSVLQLFLMVLGVCRKSRPSPFINFLAWLAYIYANSLSYFTMVLPFVDKSKTDRRLVAFWASFFLLHLGGVDSLNACSPQDNRIWKRCWWLTLQIFFCAVVLKQCPVRGVWAALVYLVLGIGVCSCVERIWVHRHASIMKSETHHHLPHQITVTATTPNSWRVRDVNLLLLSGWVHKSFGGLYHHRMYCERHRDIVKHFFAGLTPQEAFLVAGNEMSLRYDAIYTKIPALHTRWGRWSRFCFFVLMLGCAMVFGLAVDKQGLPFPDIAVTAMLFAVDILIRSCSLYWMVFSSQIRVHNFLNNQSNNNDLVMGDFNYFQLEHAKFYVGRFCLFSYGIEHPASYIKLFLRLINPARLLANHVHILDDDQIGDLQARIFETLEDMSGQVYTQDSHLAFTQRQAGGGTEEVVEWSASNRSLGEICWLWIIATNLLLYGKSQNWEVESMVAKQLVDYLLCLLKEKPDLMSSAAPDSAIITADTLADLRSFTNEGGNFNSCPDLALALALHSQNVHHRRGNRSMSVLWDGCKLGVRLWRLQMTDQEIVGILETALVELLSTVSLGCRGELHAQLLGEGRELITFIWWITIQLGFRQHFGAEICS